MKPVAPKQLARALPISRALSVVEKRKANNAKKPTNKGYRNRVTDNDPMQKDSESNYP